MITVKKSIFDCWHCIVPVGRANNYARVKEIRSWCRDNFVQGQWGFEDLHTKTSFILYSEEDVLLFTLRWS